MDTSRGYKRIQEDTRGYKMIQEDTSRVFLSMERHCIFGDGVLKI
jgi:hypothetical protein